MTLDELKDQVGIILQQLFVKHRQIHVARTTASLHLVEDFGTLICCADKVDHGQVNITLLDNYKGWRSVFVARNESLLEIRFKILWGLMRGGYMRWMRSNYPRQIRNILIGPENLGQRIIEERLRVWGDRPKYRFLIDDNKAVLRNGITRELADDPGFFDYLSEEEL